MDAATQSDAPAASDPTTVERTSECEVVVTRAFAAPVQAVFRAWTTPELLKRWWAPKSFGVAFVSCEADVRTGGAYRFVMSHPGSDQPMAFFGRYTEVTPPSRLVWTNEESPEGPVTTVTFADHGGGTRVVMHELHPSKQALDDAVGSDSLCGYTETFEQLDAFLAAGGDVQG